MDRVRVERDLIYRGTATGGLKMDVYVPAGLATTDRRPVVFFVHGGPVSPDMHPKDWGVFRSYGALAAASGFVGVSFNHRLYGLDYTQAAEDLAAAVEFVRSAGARFHADVDRTALWVFSGGGPFLGPALAAPPPHLKALVSYYGNLDLRGARERDGTPIAEDLAARFSPVVVLETAGGPFPPVLIARAGKDDPRINASVEAFTRAAWSKGLALDVLNHPTGQHGFDILDDDARSREVIRRTLDFLTERLKP